jgi:hypothetical protein
MSMVLAGVGTALFERSSWNKSHSEFPVNITRFRVSFGGAKF